MNFFAACVHVAWLGQLRGRVAVEPKEGRFREGSRASLTVACSESGSSTLRGRDALDYCDRRIRVGQFF